MIVGKLGSGEGWVKFDKRHFVEGGDLAQMRLLPLIQHGITEPTYYVHLDDHDLSGILTLSWSQKPIEKES